MLVRRITFTALFALVAGATAMFGVPTLAQSQDDDQEATIKQDKHAQQGWEKADNGAYVNPADDPRYPGASPSVGIVESKDDMDSDGFKPRALIEGDDDDDFDIDDDDEVGVTVTRQTTTVVQEPAPVQEATPLPQDDSTMRTDVDADVDTSVDTTPDTTTDVDVLTETEVETTTAAPAAKAPTAPAATSTRRHTRLE